MLRWLSAKLDEPRLRGVDVGSPEFFRLQAGLIRERRLLRYCYDVWYRTLLDDETLRLAPRAAVLLELGSGGSLLKSYDTRILTSDVVAGVAEQVIDARRLPFQNDSVTAIFMTHVFHHIPDVRAFLYEAQRVLVPGGIVAMIDVAATPLARLCFRHFHREPFRTDVRDWEFSQDDSMMDANQALTWIVFRRDRAIFEREFPRLRLETIRYLPWIPYLLSGGVTKRQLLPDLLARGAIVSDSLLRFTRRLFALHWHLKLRKHVP